MKKKIGEIIIQIIPVMIGVYLGFLVSDWADWKNKKTQSEKLIENILYEVNTNKEKLEGVIEYHKMLRDSSRFYSNNGSKMGKPDFFKGTRIETLNSSAYQTGLQTGIINELPLSYIQRLNQLYTFQDSYNDFGVLLLNGLINKDFSDKEESMIAIARYLLITMTDVVIQEENLLKDYNDIKRLLDP